MHYKLSSALYKALLNFLFFVINLFCLNEWDNQKIML